MVYTCNVNDANSIADVAHTAVAPSTIAMVVATQAPAYTENFNSGGVGRVEGGELLEQVSSLFTAIHAPVGLSNKLIGLQGFAINIKIDDSGSMNTRCANGYTRWQNVEQRLHQFMNLLQVVPTGAVTLSFLNRRDVITIKRQGWTPQDFLASATKVVQTAFRSSPSGGTPIYANVLQMLQLQQANSGPTAHYLFTDGQPSGSGYSAENEIKYTKDALLARWNPQQNPFTFLCCSDNPVDTIWMHEIEEAACRPGALGYVAALQNFVAERLEVLNDQGPEFPYTEAVWILCCLVAALNPNDLDALDQHAPLSKPTLDGLLGHVLSLADYASYFNQHPNATWLFREDYELFLTTQITSRIPAVNWFESTLGQQLLSDINNGNVNSEPRAITRIEEALLARFNRSRPEQIRRARQDFWFSHYLTMERMQAQYFSAAVNNGVRAKQDLWGDYVAWSGLGSVWRGYVEQCRTGGGLGADLQSSDAPPPSYAASVGSDSSVVPGGPVVPMQQPPAILYYPYTMPLYYRQRSAYGDSYAGAAPYYPPPNPNACCCIL